VRRASESGRGARSLEDLAAEAVPGHRVEVLLDGAQAFPAMLRAIDAAERSCYLETYILRDDRIGRTFARALAGRARAGVETALIYDAVGSLGLPASYVGYLAEAGVRVASYHGRPWRVWEWNQRDHRKSLVVDGRVGFLGGINIGDEYDAREKGGGGWRDTQVRIEGPAVAEITRLFARTFLETTGRPLERAGEASPPPLGGPASVAVLGNRRHGERSKLRRAYLDAIDAARGRVRITSAYFIPDRGIRRALARAARRGVDVRVITAGVSDVLAEQLASRALYPGLLKAGVRLFERIERVLHAKTAVVDGRWSAVGSYNLNRRSIFHDLEVLATIVDEDTGAALERAFERDLADSLEVTRRAVRARPLLERALGQFFLRFATFL
jgi:cardiolipin synthase